MSDEIFTKEAEEEAKRLSGELFDFAKKYGCNALACVFGGVIAGIAHTVSKPTAPLLAATIAHAQAMHGEIDKKLKEKEPDLKQG